MFHDRTSALIDFSGDQVRDVHPSIDMFLSCIYQLARSDRLFYDHASRLSDSLSCVCVYV